MPLHENNPTRDEARLIPWWSYVLAAAFFVGIQVAVHLVLAPSGPRPRSFALTSVWGVLVGMFLAFYMLMIGYVMRDARRRGMNPTVWLFILISLLPSGVGFIVYFLLRQPLAMSCPQCSAAIAQDFNFCTKCHYQLRAVCRSCHRALRPADLFCAECGASTEETAIRASR